MVHMQKWLVGFLNPYLENSVTSDLRGILLISGKKKRLNVWAIGKKPAWVCHFVQLCILLIGQWFTALSHTDGPDIGNINNYWDTTRKKGVAVHVLFSLDLLCHDMLNLFDDMFLASCLSCAADWWSQLEAWIPTPRCCIIPCADAFAFWDGFPSVTWVNRNPVHYSHMRSSSADCSQIVLLSNIIVSVTGNPHFVIPFPTSMENKCILKNTVTRLEMFKVLGGRMSFEKCNFLWTDWTLQLHQV